MPHTTRSENTATAAHDPSAEQSGTPSGAAGQEAERSGKPDGGGAGAGAPTNADAAGRRTEWPGKPGGRAAAGDDGTATSVDGFQPPATAACSVGADGRLSDSGGTSAASWRGLAPWLALWGAVAVVRALSAYAAQWTSTAIVQQAVTWAAAAATLAGLLAWLLRRPAAQRGAGLRAALPLLTVLASVALLEYVHAVDAFFAPMFRTLVLAVAFVYAGASGWRGLLALGLWLLAAAVVLGVWYLGYAPLVLEGLSGLALLAAALLLRKQTRPSRTGG